MNVKRGDIFFANLTGVVGSEQGGIRPVVVIQNNTGNLHSPTIIVATITSQTKASLPTHVTIKGYGLKKESIVLLEQVRTIDKCRLKGYIGHVDELMMKKIDKAKEISMSDASVLKPIDRLSEELKGRIQIMLENVCSYERAIANRKNNNNNFRDMCLSERELWLDTLKDFCKRNNLNYKNYYQPYEQKCELQVIM
ncbi:TPA: type II toxin-antitoxin system PemK/MazF family toxin [Clostridium botulinum]|nr:type II toxin-antitoxin system PemK/MazF family toxin [Clostridium botulinum]HBJ1652912.1 type II toxin-antitoxin system PemK/MazF family toxin [Clostridium botulinum]